MKHFVLSMLFLWTSFFSPTVSTTLGSDQLSHSFSMENTNIFSYDGVKRFSDFNRLRFDGYIEIDSYPSLSATYILDNKTRYIPNSSSLTNKLDLYRCYISYVGNKHSASLGRQRIPFGVGRIWTPTDIFNPLNSTSIEPDEREGTDSIRYEVSLGNLSSFDATLSRDKAAARIKGFLETADIALLILSDNDIDRTILGWELEGELSETGIELRSEGGTYYDRKTNSNHWEFILGGEYGFPNSLTLQLEYYFDGKTDYDRLGLSTSYQMSSLLTLTLLGLVNLNDHSYFMAPSFSYSLSDEMTLSGGVFVYMGNDHEDFGMGENSMYINWFVHL